MSKKLLFTAVCLAAATAARAEVQRTQYSVENRFPKLMQLETGASLKLSQVDDTPRGDVDTTAITPYARFGLLENLTASASLPLITEDSDAGSSEFGLGSVGFGLDLRAYQDILGYPFVIPHAEVQIDTADDSIQGVAGDTRSTVGIAVGTVVNDDWTFVVDGRYVVSQDYDNVVEGSLSIAWAWSERFSWLGEVKLSDSDDAEDTGVNGLGGFSYNWTRKLSSSFHAGAGQDSGEDVTAIAKFAYSW